MATVNFNLKDLKTKGESLIFLIFRYPGNRFKYSLSEKIAPKHWNLVDQKVKRSYDGSTEFNLYLKKVDTAINGIYRTAIAENIQPTLDYLRDKLKKELQHTNERFYSFNDYFNQFLESKKTTQQYATVQVYKSLQSHLLAFQKKQGVKTTFEKIDMGFYDRLISWFINDLELLTNTVGKYIITLRAFLNWATEREYNTKTTYLKFKAPSNDVESVALTENELMQLYNYDFSDRPNLERVRDSFCFGCFTSLRFSDICEVKREYIQEGVITMVIKKTKKELVIPLNDYSKEILEKYDYKLPTITNQKTNKYLKILGKIAKINTPITIKKYCGKKVIKTTEPKYMFLSSHTARRSFVTISLEKRMRPETVMSITGHTNYETFKKYIKLTKKIKTIEMQKVWKKPTKLKRVS